MQKHSIPSLVILLATTVVSQFGPPAQTGCALIIPGPGRSSAFDHASGVFGHNPGFSENTCITYEAVNACLLYTSPSPRDGLLSRMPSSA